MLTRCNLTSWVQICGQKFWEMTSSKRNGSWLVKNELYFTSTNDPSIERFFCTEFKNHINKSQKWRHRRGMAPHWSKMNFILYVQTTHNLKGFFVLSSKIILLKVRRDVIKEKWLMIGQNQRKIFIFSIKTSYFSW